MHVMARPPHKLAIEKLTEGVGGLRTMEDVGIKIHKLKTLETTCQDAVAGRPQSDRRFH